MNRNTDEEIELIDIDLDVEDSKTKVEELTGEDEPEEAKKKTKPDSVAVLKEIFSYVLILALAVAIAFTINRFVIINANIPTRSMVPAINSDDKLIGFRLAYLFAEPERGDVIVFEHQCYNTSENEALIKRVIGIPGDEVLIKDGILYINGEKVTEDYIAEPMEGNFGPYTVPDNSYFVMGDNRSISDDARYWDNTYVSKDEILAKALFKYSPSFSLVE